MASKSQTSYMVAMALVIGGCKTISENYTGPTITPIIANLKESAQRGLDFAHGDLDQKQINAIGKKLTEMQKDGLDGADSVQVYLSMMIGILSDLIAEIPKTSSKQKPLADVLSRAESAWRYFSSRTRNERFDADGFKLVDSFETNFKEAP